MVKVKSVGVALGLGTQGLECGDKNLSTCIVR